MKKSIVIKAKEWFDKVNGNSYFSGTIQVDNKVYLMPFQYGYGTQYEQEAKNLLTEFNVISCDYGQNLRSYCLHNNIDYSAFITTKCKKRELKEIENKYNEWCDKMKTEGFYLMKPIDKAIKYFTNEGLEVYADDGTMYLVIDGGLHIALSSSEIYYRAEMYDLNNENN